jgi:nicotinate-nucleotide pyrophosphorylase (carboxylating)
MDLDLSLMRDAIARFVKEDVGRGDATTTAVVPVEAHGTARIEARGDFVVAGLEIAAACFDYVGPGTVRWTRLLSDGSDARAGEVLARLDGSLHTILIGERTALNLLGRLSGVATLTRSFVAAIEGTPARIVDTSKTTPGLRLLEKYAVRAGGGHNHRFGLDDGILIKDNHVRLAGGMAEAVKRMKEARREMPIEVEAQSLADVDAAVAAGADVILLDNLSMAEIREAIQKIGGRAQVEISGGVTLERIPELARTGASYVSIGALTHSAPAADLSFELEPDV